MTIWYSMWGEIKKCHQQNFHSKMIYFSLLIWPVLLFVTAYYSLKPFNLSDSSPLTAYMEMDQVSLFLLTGYLGYIFFWSLVQSAWQMAYERQVGTLELIFLTPVSRLAFIYGRAAGNLFEAVWLFSVFSLLAFIAIGGIDEISWISMPIGVLVLFVSAIIWGGFLNVLFYSQEMLLFYLPS